MAKKSKLDLSDLENYLKTYSKTVCRIAVGKIRDELTEEARTAIELFYESYSPVYYNRHYENFRKRSFKKYYANPHNQVYYGGVQLTQMHYMKYIKILHQKYLIPCSRVFMVLLE